MPQDCFHNQYSNQQLLHILWDECDQQGIEVPDIAVSRRCSIAAALEELGVRFEA